MVEARATSKDGGVAIHPRPGDYRSLWRNAIRALHDNEPWPSARWWDSLDRDGRAVHRGDWI